MPFLYIPIFLSIVFTLVFFASKNVKNKEYSILYTGPKVESIAQNLAKIKYVKPVVPLFYAISSQIMTKSKYSVIISDKHKSTSLHNFICTMPKR